MVVMVPMVLLVVFLTVHLVSNMVAQAPQRLFAFLTVDLVLPMVDPVLQRFFVVFLTAVLALHTVAQAQPMVFLMLATARDQQKSSRLTVISK